MRKQLTAFAIPPERKTGTFSLLASLGFALLGQTLFALSATNGAGYEEISEWLARVGDNASPLPGILSYLAAIFFLLRGLKQLGTPLLPASAPQTASPALAQPARMGFWFSSLGLALFAAYQLSLPGAQERHSNGYPILAVWILSLGLFLYHQVNLPTPRTLLDLWRKHKKEILALLLLLLLAFSLRLLDLELHPSPMNNDEGEVGKSALCFLRGECNNFFDIGWAHRPRLAFLPYLPGVAWFGNASALSVRVGSALLGGLAVLFTALFAREAFGRAAGWVAGVLLSALPYHLHFSRTGVDNIVDSLTSALLLWLTYRAVQRGERTFYLAAGIIAGLCFYTYPGSRLSAGLALLFLLYVSLFRRGFLRANTTNLLMAGIAFFLTLAPLLGSYTINTNDFNGRLNMVGIVESGYLQSQTEATGRPAVYIVARQFALSFLPFVATGAPANFFNSPRPYFSFGSAILLLLGIGLVLARLREERAFLVLAWFIAPILFGSALTISAPSSQRMLGATPAAVILAAISLVSLTKALQSLNQAAKVAAPALLLLFLLLNGVVELKYYFGEYRSGNYYADLSNEIVYESRTYISDLGKNGIFYMVGAPVTYVVFGNFGYFSPDTPKFDFNEISPAFVSQVPTGKNILFVATPSREADLRQIAAQLPGGEWITVPRRSFPQEILFFAYQIRRQP